MTLTFFLLFSFLFPGSPQSERTQATLSTWEFLKFRNRVVRPSGQSRDCTSTRRSTERMTVACDTKGHSLVLRSAATVTVRQAAAARKIPDSSSAVSQPARAHAQPAGPIRSPVTNVRAWGNPSIRRMAEKEGGGFGGRRWWKEEEEEEGQRWNGWWSNPSLCTPHTPSFSSSLRDYDYPWLRITYCRNPVLLQLLFFLFLFSPQIFLIKFYFFTAIPELPNVSLFFPWNEIE